MPYRVVVAEDAKEFLDSLPAKLRAKAYRSIGLLREFGPFLRLPHSKSISDWPGLMELRVILGSDICRLFYFRHRDAYYVVTSGYRKKSQKLDPGELSRAFQLMRRLMEE